MRAKKPETTRLDFSHWPWAGWVDNASPSESALQVEMEGQASQPVQKYSLEDQEWETLILRLF